MHGLTASLRTRTAAHVADAELVDLDFFFDARRRLFERDLQIVPQIRAALTPLGVAAASLRAAEKLLEDAARPTTSAALHPAEHLAEQIERIDPTCAFCAACRALGKRRVPIPVIRRALVGIVEDIVSLAQLLEPLFSLGITRILVGVVLDR